MLDAEGIAALLEALEGSDFSFFEISSGDTRITVTRGDAPVPEGFGERGSNIPTASAPAAAPASAAAPVAPVAAPAPQGAAGAATGTAVTAPMMGTFYAAPKPGEPSFVAVGDRVEADTQIAIIEVMKLMTPVVAGVAGVVRAACVSDGELVDFGLPLFYIEEDV